MDFSIRFPKFMSKRSIFIPKADCKKMQKILLLRDDLISVGYNPCEVDYMIGNFSKGIRLSKLESTMIKTVEDALEAQLLIARQCIEFVSGANE